uniref:protein disulfide-isomerase n=1 Tax=Podarcis muralis TaxID=64176 RepID=A0A670IKJ4_PODMU
MEGKWPGVPDKMGGGSWEVLLFCPLRHNLVSFLSPHGPEPAPDRVAPPATGVSLLLLLLLSGAPRPCRQPEAPKPEMEERRLATAPPASKQRRQPLEPEPPGACSVGPGGGVVAPLPLPAAASLGSTSSCQYGRREEKRAAEEPTPVGGRFKENRKDDIWLVDFYAPWCGHCKKLEPVWNEVGKEMGSTGSPVKVGKMDATSYSSIASEFGVRGYPTIKLPIIRPLPSQQMFEHVQKRHRVFFLYIGGESPLKEKYIEVASELIVYTYFFSASEEILPEYVTLPEMPAVIVFKDGTYFVYDEYEDGDLSSWISKERFQGYLNVDGFTLYELGDTGKLVAIAIIDDKNTSVEHIRLKSIMQDVAKNYRDHFHRSFQFGHMDGNEYMNSLLMDDLKIPTIVVLNTSNQQYFLPHKPIESTEDMVQFINEILEGTAEAHGGDGILQRIKRIIYDAKSTVGSVFKSSPLLGCFLFGLPLGVISIMCYGICMADSDGRLDEVDASKKESTGRELTDEGTEEEQEEENSENRLEFPGGEEEQKTIFEKKKD